MFHPKNRNRVKWIWVARCTHCAPIFNISYLNSNPNLSIYLSWQAWLDWILQKVFQPSKYFPGYILFHRCRWWNRYLSPRHKQSINFHCWWPTHALIMKSPRPYSLRWHSIWWSRKRPEHDRDMEAQMMFQRLHRSLSMDHPKSFFREWTIWGLEIKIIIKNIFYHGISQHTTHNTQHTTRNTQQTPRNTQHTPRNIQHATRNTQHTPRNTHHATRNIQHTTRNTLHMYTTHNAFHTTHYTEHTTLNFKRQQIITSKFHLNRSTHYSSPSIGCQATILPFRWFCNGEVSVFGNHRGTRDKSLSIQFPGILWNRLAFSFAE